MITLTIPYPPKILNKNNQKGAHWAAISKARAIQKQEAFTAVRERYAEFNFTDTSKLWIVWNIWIPHQERRRDEDNLDFKSAQDGLCQAVGVDDNQILVTVRLKRGKAQESDGKIDVIMGEIGKDEMPDILRW